MENKIDQISSKDLIDIRRLCINTIRTLSMDAVQKANSGHPGTPMALAPVAFTIWNQFMKFNPQNPHWPNRDRFVLSAGHASMLLYSILHILNFDVSLDDIKNFRQLNSLCAGHPEFGLTPGVETTTGPLGQGIATSVGMAIAEKWLERYFNRPDFNLIDYNIFAIAGDGCMMEGISHEAASLAGHLGLNNLVWIYDNNSITIEGSTDLAFSEDVALRFKSYNWRVEQVENANDLELLTQCLQSAVDETKKPTLIIVNSHIAFGAPNKQDTASAHGEPLGEEEIRAAKIKYGWDPDKKFYIPEEVKKYITTLTENGNEQESLWNQKFANYSETYPVLASQFRQIQNHELPEGWEAAIPLFAADDKGLATRQSNGKILDKIAQSIPWFMGGAADLMPSTKTGISGTVGFARDSYGGRIFHFGIREHAMGAIVNGMVLSGLRAFGATFFVFSDYMRPAIRLAALMELPSLFIFTHDSIGLGEDGPTHQPVEHLAALRAIPNLDVIRPADASELGVMWKFIMKRSSRPAALVLTRQAVPTIERTKYAQAEAAGKGAYILADSEGLPQVILIGTGSEIALCLDVYERLKIEGIRARVVSMPCWSLFDRQPVDYRESVLPEAVPTRISVEAGITFGWQKYTGLQGINIGVDEFGASAPYKELYQKYGLTTDRVYEAAKQILNI